MREGGPVVVLIFFLKKTNMHNFGQTETSTAPKQPRPHFPRHRRVVFLKEKTTLGVLKTSAFCFINN
jgi:hypothetical protein